MLVDHEIRHFAKHLRRRLSLPEGLLWRALKAGQLRGLKFRKQHPIGPYVLDFYCHQAALCVEVDGNWHNFGPQPKKDSRRDAWLEEKGIRTLRVPATLILNDVDDAVRTILAALEEHEPSERKPPPALWATSPCGGGTD